MNGLAVFVMPLRGETGPDTEAHVYRSKVAYSILDLLRDRSE